MSETKACTITEEEVTTLIMYHSHNLNEQDLDERLERLNYLNKRLKAFREEGVKPNTEQPINADPNVVATDTAAKSAAW